VADHQLVHIPKTLWRGSQIQSLLHRNGKLAKDEPALETGEVIRLVREVRMDSDSMQTHRSTSDIQDSHVLDGPILDDLNGASRQGFHLVDRLLDAVS
jgi:hypothetical protein